MRLLGLHRTPRGVLGPRGRRAPAAPVSRAAALLTALVAFAFSHRPITPFMGPSKEGTRILHYERLFTNMSKDMCSGNRPNFNTDSGLTQNGRGSAGERPGSARERNAAGSPRASRPALRGFFAPGTPASSAAAPGGSGCLPADIAALAAPPGRPSRAAGEAVEVTSAAPAAGVETEASSRPGTAARSARVVGGRWRDAHPTGLKATRTSPDVEPDAQPAPRSQRRVGRRVDILADVARANPFTPPSGGPFSVRR